MDRETELGPTAGSPTSLSSVPESVVTRGQRNCRQECGVPQAATGTLRPPPQSRQNPANAPCHAKSSSRSHATGQGRSRGDVKGRPWPLWCCLVPPRKRPWLETWRPELPPPGDRGENVGPKTGHSAVPGTSLSLEHLGLNNHRGGKAQACGPVFIPAAASFFPKQTSSFATRETPHAPHPPRALETLEVTHTEQ